MGNGIVIKNTGSSYHVIAGDGTIVNCKVKGNFRLKGIRTTNPVAVGDEVSFTANATDGTAYITAIAPRRNYIIRRASNLSKEAHILAANVDQAFLVVSFKNPLTSTTFIDRFLATAEAYSVPVILVINKTDILDPEELQYVDAVTHLYSSIGYEVLQLSATSSTPEHISRLHAMAQGKISLIAGNSGVGKSTIINRLIPGLDLRTGDVSATHHTGMHTTTFSEMHPLPGGGYLIDTPGVKGFGTVDFGDDVAHYFREIFARSSDCKYGNCTHTHEPGCAVREAVEQHLISESRYASYLSILSDKEEGKYRKPF
ncbi:MAG: ribosome small subunit-dependent GTPase A [Muribaculaceae bacterium]